MFIKTVESKIITPDNDQRTDIVWQWEAIPTEEQKANLKGQPFIITLGPNSQCVGNTFQDLLFLAASEFPDKLPGMALESTFDYYSCINAYLFSLGDPYGQEDLKYFLTHVKFLNDLFKRHGVPIRAKGIEIPKKEQTTETILYWIEKTNRSVGIGTFLTGPGGHWMRVDKIHVYDDHLEIEGNDPFGTSPYKTATQKTRVRVTYKDLFLNQKTIRRIAVLEDYTW